MLFKPEHIELIRKGIKTETRRDWKKQAVIVGRLYPIMRDYRHKWKPEDGWIRVRNIYTQKLKDITEASAYAEGGYTLGQYRTVWETINGVWNPEQTVYVIQFEYVRAVTIPIPSLALAELKQGVSLAQSGISHLPCRERQTLPTGEAGKA